MLAHLTPHEQDVPRLTGKWCWEPKRGKPLWPERLAECSSRFGQPLEDRI